VVGAALSWVHLAGADACIGTHALARAVEERLGRVVFVPARDADVVVEGSIERRGGDWRAVLVARDKADHEIGRRALVVSDAGPSCDAMTKPVVDAVVDLVPALAIAVGTVEEKKKADALEKAREQRAAAAVTARPRLGLEAGASFTDSVGLMPELTAIGVGFDALVETRRLLGLRGFLSFWADRTARPGDDFSMALAGGGPCVALVHAQIARASESPLTLRACVEGELGVLRARSSDAFAQVRPSAAVLVNVDAGLRLTIPVTGPFVARGGASLVVPLLRERFIAGSALAPGADTEVFRVSPVAMIADVGLGVAFP